MKRRFLTIACGGLMLAVASGAAAPTSSTAADTADRGRPPQGWPTDFHAWTTARDFARGEASAGVQPTGGAITLADGVDEGTWTSPWYTTPDPFTQAVPSWQADTPPGSWIEIEFQVRTDTVASQWYAMGQWALDAGTIQRQTVDGQSDDIGRIYTDTFVAKDTAPGGDPVDYRLKVTMHAGADTAPSVGQLAATTSAPGSLPTRTSRPLSHRTVELDVPPYSQSTHSGEYPQFGGGGQVWCSPTSTSMVLSHWQTGPTAEDITSLPPDEVFDANGRADGQVDWAAVHTWDYTYEGAGNWAFNTAYAATYGLDASVRQYDSLREVERWVRRGVPVVTSIAWDNADDDPTNDLDGSSISGTNGHLMVVIGFTASGDVIANDPASPSNDEVRHVYRRDQFEHNWLRASDGTTYVIKPAGSRG